MGIRWLVLAGAILALQAPSLDLLSLKLSLGGYLPRIAGVSLEETGFVLQYSYEYRFNLAFGVYCGACVLLALMAFPFREHGTARIASLTVFFLVATLDGLSQAFDPPSGLPKAVRVALPVAGLCIVAGQLCARLGTATASGTARLWIGVLIGTAVLDGWIRWHFSPWLLGMYLGLAGAGMIIVGEAKGLRKPPSTRTVSP